MAILINLNDARKKLNELEGSAEYNKGVTDAFNALFDLPTIEAVPTEAQIREYLFKNNYTMRLIAKPTDGIDLQELEDRFGKYVRFVVEDMISGGGKRWKNEN